MKSRYILPAMVAASVILGLVVAAAVLRHSATISTPPKTDVPEEPAPPPPPPAPVYRYKVEPQTAGFGQPFDYSTARVLPENLRPFKMKAGILIDLDRRKVIWEYNSHAPVPIASLTKLLTIYTAFEELERRPSIDLDSLATVSIDATETAPVKMHFKPGEKVSVHELFTCAMLKSANDAAHLIAEYFGNGRTANFIAMMNDKAREIGMTQSHFVNANGLPIYSQNEATKMNTASANDFALLIERVYEYPMILRYTGLQQAATAHGPVANGNRLLGKVPGMEGMKTGFTQAAGHCLAFSCRRNGRRLIGMVTGFQKRPDCFLFAEKLLDWGFRIELP